ncbi:MAG: S41 family peptidase [Schleiferiaceae bacterium]|nr:S41 family peptidase [Schleiferiaceae bacterium]
MQSRLFFIVLTLILGVFKSPAQFSQEQVQEDFQFLEQSIKTYNPALFLYNPDFEEHTEQLFASFPDRPLNRFDHFKLMSTLCALSNEGHFGLGNWQDTVHNGFMQNRFKYLPVAISIIDGGIYVWKDYSNERLLASGDKIVSVNGMNIQDILATLKEAYPADGQIETFTIKIIENGLSWLYYLYIDQPEYYDIELTTGKTYRIKAITRNKQGENVAAYFPKKEKEEIDAFSTLKYKDNTAILVLPSFDRQRAEKFKVSSKKFYAQIFEELNEKEVTSLIIDLRDNTGGRNEFADDLVPFILKQNESTAFLKKTISWEGKEKTYKMPKKSKDVFNGEIYVLVNGHTYSAGHTAARYLKEFGNAMIIGEETGTRYEGFAAGSQQYVTLPNLGIQIAIPRYHIQFPASELQPTSNRGLLPNHAIHATWESKLEEKDLHMIKAFDLISKN